MQVSGENTTRPRIKKDVIGVMAVNTNMYPMANSSFYFSTIIGEGLQRQSLTQQQKNLRIDWTSFFNWLEINEDVLKKWPKDIDRRNWSAGKTGRTI